MKKRISRTKAVYSMLNSKGQMFSVKWKTNSGQERKLNGKMSRIPKTRKDQDKIFGYLTLFNVSTKQHKRVNTRTITELNINKTKYRVV